MRRALAPILLGAVLVLTSCGLLDTDHPPTAVLVADPTSGRAPLRVRLDGSGSFDDGAIARATWTVDGESQSASVDGDLCTECTFETCGTHVVRLTIIDDEGLTGTAEVVIEIENVPPLASCRFSSDSPVVGEWILFDASASFDPDGKLIDFTWDFGDGTTTRGTRVGHAFDTVGVYDVRLTIEDDAGATASIVHSFTVHLGGSGGGCGGGGGTCLSLR